MSKQLVKRSWGDILVGVAMLGFVVLALIVVLSNEIGIGRTLAMIFLATLIVAWVITGIVLVLRGLSKI